jgi:L,D-transpeptidase ErfK/SrfK
MRLGQLLLSSIALVSVAASALSDQDGVKPAAAHREHTDVVIGELQQYRVAEKESLIEIARKFDLGFNAIVAANPTVDPIIPKAGTLITIPTSWIPPAVSKRPCMVINLAEFRLYYFPKRASGGIVTFPLGIGDEGRDTPLGSYKVVEKIVNPAWHVPKSIRGERSRLPEVVPPGPNNPMGTHALRLSLHSVLIHGTNKPWGIGRRSSHGCLRLYPEDIIRLFRMVSKGTRVVVVNKPLKVAAKGDRVFVEVHRIEGVEPGVGDALHLLADRNLVVRTDFAKLIRAVEEKRGVPVNVTLAR